LGVSQQWEFKNTTNNALQKNRFDFFLGFVLSRFWAFLGGGVKEYHKKTNREKI
jgi:hypothetical protein